MKIYYCKTLWYPLPPPPQGTLVLLPIDKAGRGGGDRKGWELNRECGCLFQNSLKFEEWPGRHQVFWICNPTCTYASLQTRASVLPLEIPESCPLEWLRNSFGLARWGLAMRNASTGPESALLRLKVSRLSLSLLCANMSGLGGRGTLFNEISFESRFELTAFSKYDDPPCRDCSLDESNEPLREFLFMLSWSVVDVLFVIHDGCCDGVGWNVSDSHCWSKMLGSSEWNNLQ